MHFSLRLLVPLVLVELLMAGALMLLARGLGRRLPLRVLAIAGLAPWLLLAPWLFGDHLLVPTTALATMVPGADPAEAGDSFDEGLNDAVLQFLPWELEVRHALARGQLPFWSDLVDGGCNLWGNLKAQVLSPIALLARTVPIQHHLLVALVLKLLVAGSGAWLLARAVGARAPAAAFAAASFAYGGALLPWAVFPHSAAAAWMPWVVLGTLTLARRPAARPLIATAVATAALLLSGHPEVALSGCALAALAAVALRARRVPWRRALGAPLGAGLLGLALAAPVWLPFLALTGGSQRAHEQAERRPSLAQVELAAPASWFTPEGASYLRGPLHPTPYWPTVPVAALDLRTHWTYNCGLYLGMVGLAGLALALARPLPRRFVPFLAVWLLAFMAVADFLPLEWTLRTIPGIRLVEDSRFLPGGCLAGSLVAACGIELLLSGRRRRRVALTLAVAAAASFLAGPAGMVLAAWTCVAFAAALAGVDRRGSWRVVGVVALACFLDLGLWAQAMLPLGKGENFYPPTRTMARLQAETSGPDGPWRAIGFDHMVFPGLLSVYGIADPRPHNPLAPQAQIDTLAAAFGDAPTTKQYQVRLRHLEHPLLDFLNVRVVVVARHQPEVVGLARIDDAAAAPSPIELRRNEEALPRWFLPTAVERIERGELTDWLARLTDARRVAVFADPAADDDLSERPWQPSAVTVRTARPGQLLLAVAGPGARLLATSLPGPSGWRATGGGGALTTLAVDGAYLGVVVPAGVDTVALSFVPPGLGLGLALAALALLALGGLELAARRPARTVGAPRTPTSGRRPRSHRFA